MLYREYKGTVTVYSLIPYLEPLSLDTNASCTSAVCLGLQCYKARSTTFNSNVECLLSLKGLFWGVVLL